VNIVILDVGCGSIPRGDINIDAVKKSGYNLQTGNQWESDYIDVKSIKNYIIADVHHLPIKDKSIDVVLSSHVIEHVAHPALMLREMVRVSKRKVIIRYPHRRGSGAKRPFHINYIDENWIDIHCPKNVRAEHFTSILDAYITARMKLKIPERFMPIVERYTPFRILLRIERNLVWYRKYKIPFEAEAWIRKPTITKSSRIVFVVVYNSIKTLNTCFLSSQYVQRHKLLLINNNFQPNDKRKIAVRKR
jgi:SAM-dependent methyltransferase